MRPAVSWVGAGILSLLLASCTGTPGQPARTRAEAAARAYGEAIVRTAWSDAYAALDPGSRAQISAQRFTHWAAGYRASFAFEPHGFKVRCCEEQGDQAIAHVVFTGPGVKRQRYQDSFVLRRTATGWGVVLSAVQLGS